MAFDVYSRNGEILPASEAVVPLSNVEYAYGFGVYETIRAVRGKAVFLPDHVERLLKSAEIIDLTHPFSAEHVSQWITALLERLGPETVCNIKVLLIGASAPERCVLHVIPLAPLFPDKRLYARGASALTVPHERMFPQAKTLNMFPSYMAYRKAKAAGCYDALFTDRAGCITEGTRTNFFAISGKTIHSPPLKDVLEGVTRLHVLQAAKGAGFTVEEHPIPLASLGGYDGAFLTSTSSKVMPLIRIDDHAFANVSAGLLELIAAFEAFLATER